MAFKSESQRKAVMAQYRAQKGGLHGGAGRNRTMKRPIKRLGPLAEHDIKRHNMVVGGVVGSLLGGGLNPITAGIGVYIGHRMAKNRIQQINREYARGSRR